MKKQLVAGFIALNMIVAVGCKAEKIDPKEPENNISQPQQSEENTQLAKEIITRKGEGITYDILTLAFLEEDLQTSLNHIQMHRGFGIMKEEEDALVVYNRQ